MVNTNHCRRPFNLFDAIKTQRRPLILLPAILASPLGRFFAPKVDRDALPADAGGDPEVAVLASESPSVETEAYSVLHPDDDEDAFRDAS